MSATQPPHLPVGQHVGPYRLVRLLGEGGMGAVYEAVQPQLGRRVAIKILHAEHAREPEVAGRFFNEARAANLVQHPGIVGVFEVGQLADGRAYIVMEYLAGEALRARMTRAPRMGLAALRFGRQVASALAAAHGAGIVHRDLKPDNVLIVADPEITGGERIKVLDFGIAKLGEAHRDPGDPRTRTDLVMGTPTYMSPEQCRGLGRVDDRTDVYALGVMLYQLIVGRPPFEADGVGALLARHIYEAPPPPEPWDPEVSPAAAQLIMELLAKDARARPTMAEVAAALDQLLLVSAGGRVTVALPPPDPRHTLTPPPGHTTRGAAPGRRIAGALLALLIGGAGILALRSGARDESMTPMAQPEVKEVLRAAAPDLAEPQDLRAALPDLLAQDLERIAPTAPVSAAPAPRATQERRVRGPRPAASPRMEIKDDNDIPIFKLDESALPRARDGAGAGAGPRR